MVLRRSGSVTTSQWSVMIGEETEMMEDRQRLSLRGRNVVSAIDDAATSSRRFAVVNARWLLAWWLVARGAAVMTECVPVIPKRAQRRGDTKLFQLFSFIVLAMTLILIYS
ncbi:hypothetical protein E2542_SST11222 [Spatholobus suberectus]|nr:hypothetical protein E2542_SST11222 [Spatholobus suberectus]